MKILYVDWTDLDSDRLVSLMEEHGHQIVWFGEKPRNYHYDPVIRKKITACLSEGIACLFSIQYFPLLSNICEKAHVYYLTWNFNAPVNELLLTKSIYNSCNIICLTDSAWVEKLQRLGVQNTYYLPPAAFSAYPKEKEESGAQKICVYYTDESERYQRYLYLLSKVSDRMKGFLKGIVSAQKMIYGTGILENILNSERLNEMKACLLPQVPNDSIASFEEMYAFQILYPAVTKAETDEFFQKLPDDLSDRLCQCKQNIPDISADTVCENTFLEHSGDEIMHCNSARINLLLTPREIQNGIPLQAMQLLKTDGLLITNFQNDYLNYFEADKDIIFYDSIQDAFEKTEYYLSHEDRRKEIVKNVHEKIEKQHTLAHRVSDLLGCIS